ncbi:MAG: tyrosine-type recombinase/integrase, partial [Candidatus Dormibacteria bacterium]
REPRLVQGKNVRVQAATKLAPVSDDYPNRRSVLLLADKILAPLNTGQVQAESAMPVKDFIVNHYLPHVEKSLRPSTYKDYKKDIYEKHLEKRLGDTRLRDFRTVNGQRIIRDISEKNSDVGHTTMLRIKSFLSGTFKHARREGFIDTPNPMVDVSVPGRPVKFKGEVYAIYEIENILDAIQDTPAAVVVSVAAFTGLRLSELRGLRWSDFDGVTLNIRRSVWRTHVGETKTPESAAPVPVLPILQSMLENYRAKVKGQPNDYIFAGERRGAPLNLANLAARVIKPALEKKSDELEELVKWKGWHAFRRSLASNLYSIGVPPKVIQAILRHSDIGTTLGYYVQTPDSETREALRKIEEWMKVV